MSQPSHDPVGLVVKLPFASPEEFLARYGGNLTAGGIYLRARSVKPPGTPVSLDLKLANGGRLLLAAGIVEFVTGQAGSGISGMGIRFVRLDAESERFLNAFLEKSPAAKRPDPPLPPGVGPADHRRPSAPPAAPTVASVASVQAATSGSASPGTAPVVPLHAVPTLTAGKASPVPSAPAFEAPKEEPKRQGPIIGIDLGTTNSCSAIVRGGKPSVLASREGYNTVPSILALNARGKLVVGHPAKGQMLTNPRQTVYGAKRLVGRAFESAIVQQIKDRFAYEIAPGEHGEAAVKLGDRVYSLQQISALILREVRELAQNQLGEPVSRAVITVPAYYNDNQRQAVREAGRLAGLHVERILNEPTAAALAYGYGRKLKTRVLVYDLGGGTFDASVLELNDNVYEVISTGGDTFLGGIDFDNAIVTYLLEDFQQKTGAVFQADRVAMQRVTDAAERAKCALSERSEMRVHVPFITLLENKPYDLDCTLTREKLVELTSGLVDRTLAVCDEVLRARNLTPEDIDEVILVGGQSRFPEVHKRITEFFQKAPSKMVHPDEAVALGAALLASSLGQLDGVLLIDVLPMSIGVGLKGGQFKTVIERNSALPAAKKHTVSTSRDDQSELEISIFQGEAEKVAENEYLGTLKLNGLPPGPKGSVRIEVTFEVNNEGLLTVRARETTTGRMVSSTFTTRDSPAAVKEQTEAQTAVAPSRERPAKRGRKGGDTVPAGEGNGHASVEAVGQTAVLREDAVSPPEPRRGFFAWLRRLFGGGGSGNSEPRA